MPLLFSKQAKSVQWIGSAYTIYSATMLYQAIINAFLLSATAYNTTLRDWLPSWLHFWLFLVILMAFQLIIMFLHYKFIYPSIVAFGNEQAWKHDNPIRRDLDKIKKKLEID